MISTLMADEIRYVGFAIGKALVTSILLVQGQEMEQIKEYFGRSSFYDINFYFKTTN